MVCKAQACSSAKLGELGSLPSPAAGMVLSDCQGIIVSVTTAPRPGGQGTSPCKGGVHINVFLKSF